jgi:hypothetical protein
LFDAAETVEFTAAFFHSGSHNADFGIGATSRSRCTGWLFLTEPLTIQIEDLRVRDDSSRQRSGCHDEYDWTPDLENPWTTPGIRLNRRNQKIEILGGQAEAV